MEDVEAEERSQETGVGREGWGAFSLFCSGICEIMNNVVYRGDVRGESAYYSRLCLVRMCYFPRICVVSSDPHDQLFSAVYHPFFFFVPFFY